MKFKNVIVTILLMFHSIVYAGSLDSVNVYIFFSETCPICQSVTLNLKEIYAQFNGEGVKFTVVFPNTSVSDEKTVEKFRKKYKLPFEHKLDNQQAFVKKFSVTTTPEVILVNSSSEEVLYRGKIDNGFESIGKKRTVITEHYLRDALQSTLDNKPIQIKETKPVGCFIIKQNQ
jgi:thiol-disulfide isomerase/thioredoxin